MGLLASLLSRTRAEKLGLVGTVVAIPIILYHLYRTDFEILLWIVGIFVSVFLLEFLYIERQPFDTEIADRL